MNTVFQVVLNVTEFGMNGREAVDAPRIDHEWLPELTTYEDGAIPQAALGALQKMGHTLKPRNRQGTAHSVFVDLATGTAYGVNDQRSSDSKAAK